MRKLGVLLAIMLVPALTQAQVEPGNACNATPSELNDWAQTVESQNELDDLIAELQACPGLSVLRINQLLRAVAKGAEKNPNVVIADVEAIQLELPFEPRVTASASS